MTAQILNLDQWLGLTGNEVSGDDFGTGGTGHGSLWERATDTRTDLERAAEEFAERWGGDGFSVYYWPEAHGVAEYVEVQWGSGGTELYTVAELADLERNISRWQDRHLEREADA